MMALCVREGHWRVWEGRLLKAGCGHTWRDIFIPRCCAGRGGVAQDGDLQPLQGCVSTRRYLQGRAYASWSYPTVRHLSYKTHAVSWEHAVAQHFSLHIMCLYNKERP